jgi:hypothetical protein
LRSRRCGTRCAEGFTRPNDILRGLCLLAGEGEQKRFVGEDMVEDGAEEGRIGRGAPQIVRA